MSDWSHSRYRTKTAPWVSWTQKVRAGDIQVVRKRDRKVVGHSIQEFFPSGDGSGVEERCWDYLNQRTPKGGWPPGGTFFKSKFERPFSSVLGGGSFDIPNDPSAPADPRNSGLPSPVPSDARSGDEYFYRYEGGWGNPQFLGISGYSGLEALAAQLGPESYSPQFNPNDLASLGNRAYNKLRPKVQKANLAQDLAELHEAPDMLRTSAQGFHEIWKGLGGSLVSPKMLPSRVGNHFLNHQFGWKPFVGSVVAVCNTVINADQYFADIKAKNNQWTKKLFTEDEVTSEQLLKRYEGLAVTPNGFPITSLVVPGSAKYTITLQQTERIWYQGVFKFYRPEFDESLAWGNAPPGLQKAWQYATLFGATVSPTTVYKLTPWSWLVDWFINVGDAVQRIEDMVNNQVVSKYFCLMRKKVYRYEFRQVFATKTGQTQDLRWYWGGETKRRAVSLSPFNFSLVPGGLSGTQLAILAALGLSH